jgi:hypothetical protein
MIYLFKRTIFIIFVLFTQAGCFISIDSQAPFVSEDEDSGFPLVGSPFFSLNEEKMTVKAAWFFEKRGLFSPEYFMISGSSEDRIFTKDFDDGLFLASIIGVFNDDIRHFSNVPFLYQKGVISYFDLEGGGDSKFLKNRFRDMNYKFKNIDSKNGKSIDLLVIKDRTQALRDFLYILEEGRKESIRDHQIVFTESALRTKLGARYPLVSEEVSRVTECFKSNKDKTVCFPKE